MVAAKQPRRGPRITYKCRPALFAFEWDELRMEAQSRGISGDELVGAILSHYIKALDHPLPEPDDSDPPEDA